MNKVIMISIISVLLYSCLSEKMISYDNELVKVKFPCKECKDYLVNELKPQLETCGTFEKPKKFKLLDSREDCKFDREQMKRYGVCLYGLKRQEVELFMGKGDYYGWKIHEYCDHCTHITLTYNKSENRLIEVNNVGSNLLNHSVSCMGCEQVHTAISEGGQIKSSNFESFLERYKGCFYGSSYMFLNEQLSLGTLDEKSEEYNYHFSYTKEVELKDEKHRIKFLFSPVHTMVEMKVVD